MDNNQRASDVLEVLVERVRALETENAALNAEVAALRIGQYADTAIALVECKEFMESVKVSWDKFVRANVAIKKAQLIEEKRES